MGEYKVDLRDIRFVLKEQLRVDELTATGPYSEYSWDDFDMVITEAAKFAGEVVFPLQQTVEENHPKFENGRVTLPPHYHKVFKSYNKQGWGNVSLSPDLGGQGLPEVIGATVMELFIGACPSFTFVPGLARAAGRVIETVGSPEQIEKYVTKMYTGIWGGTMCLTEAQAGSAVGDLRTQATKQDDGQYTIKGSKIFISAGDHDLMDNIVHLVLGRTPDAPAGIKGVSLFIVNSVRDNGENNDVAVTAVEHKMGIHGSPTCSLSFGDNDECIGEIIGGEGEGIQHMFIMMNEARLAVGLQGSAIANLSYQMALDYAKERVQGVDVAAMKDPTAERVAIIKHPDVRRMLMESKALAEGTRALLLATASFHDRSQLTENANEKQRLEHLVEVLTPICKSWGSTRGFDVADLAIMVHGGYGYIREYAVEGLLRDVKIAAIYEGTNGIQALDLLGRKVARKGGLMFMSTIGWINEFVAANKEHETLSDLVAKLDAAKNTLAQITMSLGQQSRGGDLYYPVLNASPYLEMFGDVVVAKLLIEQAAIAAKHIAEDDDEEMSQGEWKFYRGKIATAKFFANRLLPRVEMFATVIRSGDRSALEMDF
ncbi:MAG: alkylation response protein AidB-like acyl-CoA dehydrogenase [Myxococcota bacterium]|jgi:alkylation response protein AidB-like acyl-CoA dehydrogenase